MKTRHKHPAVEIGQEFGEWKTVSKTTPSKTRRTRWNCLCQRCGREFVVHETNLILRKSSRCSDCAHADMGLLQVKPDTAFNDVYTYYQQSARKRNLSFDVSKDEFRRITQQICHYCGLPPSLTTFSRGGHSSYTRNGIDRKDNTVGYILGNTLPCCQQCNIWKRSIGYDEFLKAIQRIANHLNLVEVLV